jgi:hypothetical protein
LSKQTNGCKIQKEVIKTFNIHEKYLLVGVEGVLDSFLSNYLEAKDVDLAVDQQMDADFLGNHSNSFLFFFIRILSYPFKYLLILIGQDDDEDDFGFGVSQSVDEEEKISKLGITKIAPSSKIAKTFLRTPIYYQAKEVEY